MTTIHTVMPFSDFRASARKVSDLRAIPTIAEQLHDDGAPMPGRVYIDGLFIEGPSANGFTLTIGSSSRSSTGLASLESALYEFAITEGYL